MSLVEKLTMPDPLLVVRAYLLEVDEVADAVGTRILGRTGSTLPTRPFVRLDLLGGRPPAQERLDAARIQVHVFGESETEPACVAAAQTVRAALVAAWSWVHDDTGAVLAGCDISSAPMLLDDPTHSPPLVHVTFTATAYLHP